LKFEDEHLSSKLTSRVSVDEFRKKGKERTDTTRLFQEGLANLAGGKVRTEETLSDSNTEKGKEKVCLRLTD